MKSFWRDQRGNVALIFGIAVIPLVIGVGVAVDYSRAASVHDHLQEIADASALAGARENSDDLELVTRVAKAYFDAHVPPKFLNELKRFDVTFTEDESVRVEVAGSVETTFTGVVGIEQMGVEVASEVVRGMTGTLEVALVLDNTGSMSGSKIATLRSVSEALVNDLDDSDGIDAKFALVPFSNYVNLGKAHKNASWLDVVDGKGKHGTASWHGCVGSRPYPLNVRDEDYGTPIRGFAGEANCPSEVQTLTDDTGPVLSAIHKMKANGCTYIPAGLMWGWRMLSEREPFTEGKPYDPENVDPRKIIVLLTDGENTLWPDEDGRHVSNNCNDPDPVKIKDSDKYLTEICENVKSEKIELFTIAFQVTDESIKNIMQTCATSAGHYYDAADDEALRQAFAALTASFLDLRISR